MPTFVFLHSGREVDRVIGANVEMLETKIVQRLKESVVATLEERVFLEKFVEYSQRVSNSVFSILYQLFMVKNRI